MDKSLQSSSSSAYRLQETRYKHECRDLSCKDFDLEQDKKVQSNE